MSKKLFFPLFLALAAIFSVTSCGDDSCNAEAGDYIGSFIVDEDCSATPGANYTVVISAGASESEVKITGFYGVAISVDATIDCEFITIPRQEPTGDEAFVEGSGTLTKGEDDEITITLSYKVTDETGGTVVSTDNCDNTVYVKQ